MVKPQNENNIINNNGSPLVVQEEQEDDEPMVGPGPAPAPVRRHKRPLQFEQTYLDSLPSTNMYKKSYIDQNVVTHVAISVADFFITGNQEAMYKIQKYIFAVKYG